MAKITLLPLDFKGTLASNLFSGEVHTLTRATGKTNRMFAPKYGAYYKDSLEVRTGDGRLLVEGTDYATTYYYDEFWDINAKSVCAIIVITNTTVPANIRIKYQAVGGHYCLSTEELKAVLEEVDEYPSDLGWDDIRNKPLQFVPEEHEHEMWQLYGMESTVANLEMIGKAWAVGRKGVLEDNRFYYRNVIDLARQAVADYTTKVMAHINNRANPHQTDKIKIGLGDINNWGMATIPEGVTKTINNKYQPIGSVYDQLVTHVIPLHTAHIQNTNNPHNVLLSDPLLNLYSTSEILGKFSNRLLRTAPAYNTSLYSGLNTTQIYNDIRVGFSTANIQANVRFPQALIAPAIPGWDPLDYVLAGDNTYKPYTTLLQNFNNTQGAVYFIGAEPLSSYLALSEGTFVIRTVFQDFNDYRQSYTLMVYQRVAGGTGWAPLA